MTGGFQGWPRDAFDVLLRLEGEPSEQVLLRHRSLIASRALGCDDWIHTAEAADRVLDAFTQLRPLTRWLVQHVAQG